MMRQPLRTLTGLCILSLAACTFGSPSHPTRVQSIESDEFSDTVTINGADGLMVEPIVDYSAYDWYIRSFVNKKTHGVEHQLYFEAEHPPPMSHYNWAADDTAHDLPVIKIDSSRDCDPRPCSADETIGVPLSDAMLRSRISIGYRIKISARDGSNWIVDLTPGMIKLQLDAVDQVLVSLGAPPLSATAGRPPPPSPLATDCPPLGIQVAPLAPDDPPRVRRPDLRGVLVVGVEPGSRADKAGILAGDVITSYDLEPTTTPDELLAAVDAGARAVARIDGTNSNGVPWIRDVPMPGVGAGAMPKQSSGLTVDTDPYVDKKSGIRGFRATRIEPGSVAAQIGLEVGDVITACDGVPLEKAEDLQAKTGAIRGHGSVSLLVFRPKTNTQSTYILGR